MVNKKHLKLLCGDIIHESDLQPKSKQLLYEYIQRQKDDINLKSFLLNGNIKKLNESEKIDINNQFNKLIESIEDDIIEDSLIFLNCAKESIINSIQESGKIKDEELETIIDYIMNESNDYEIIHMLLNEQFPTQDSDITNVFETFNSLTNLNIVPMNKPYIPLMEADEGFIGQSKKSYEKTKKELGKSYEKGKEQLKNSQFIKNAGKGIKDVGKGLKELPGQIKKNIKSRPPTWDEYKSDVKQNLKNSSEFAKGQYNKLKNSVTKGVKDLKSDINKGIKTGKDITGKLADKAARGGGNITHTSRSQRNKEIVSRMGHIEGRPRGNQPIPEVTYKRLNQQLSKLEARKDRWDHTKGPAADRIKKQINDEIDSVKKQIAPLMKPGMTYQQLSTKMPKPTTKDVLGAGVEKTKEYMKSAGEKISGAATNVKNRIVNTLSNLPNAKEVGTRVSNSQTTKVLGGVALAALMGYASYKLYRNYMSQAAKSCSNSPNKQECMHRYRQNAVKVQINDLMRAQKSCKQSKNPQKCQLSINKKVTDLRQELTRIS